MRIGVDVGGTNTDAVLIDGADVIAATKQPTSADISTGVANAIRAILSGASVPADQVSSVTIGTTHFTNALVERDRLDNVAVMRLASPSGEALPPMAGWPTALAEKIGRHFFLLPGGYEVDGREISAFNEEKVGAAAIACRDAGINAIAISSAFAPLNAAMEEQAARVVQIAHPKASITLSHRIGRLGLIERENSAILNAALTSLARRVVTSFVRALKDLGLTAPLYISQNDGTLVSAEYAAAHPVMTIGSGPTNSMRGAAFLTGVANAVVMDVGGTTCDIGGVRTNFRMPDVLAIGLGGGTRIHLDAAQFNAKSLASHNLRVGPDSVGYRLLEES
ncbi:MAG TPA: hydantoinase/oxoprolinase family protein, partial [Verrucomicrobiae bacterium]|nr:hydantoinase/oxoprolinase family protein [Verrucomicrobiae bacterium]